MEVLIGTIEVIYDILLPFVIKCRRLSSLKILHGL